VLFGFFKKMKPTPINVFTACATGVSSGYLLIIGYGIMFDKTVVVKILETNGLGVTMGLCFAAFSILESYFSSLEKHLTQVAAQP
jgi:hypothetical protein